MKTDLLALVLPVNKSIYSNQLLEFWKYVTIFLAKTKISNLEICLQIYISV